MKKNSFDSIRKPKVIIDNSIDPKKYVWAPSFQKKIDSANEVLRTVGLPKETE